MTAAGQTIGFSLSQQQRHLWRVYKQTGWEQRPIRGRLRLEGPLDISILQAGLGNIVSRHEALRTGLEVLPGMMLPVQTVSEAMPVINVRDLTTAAAGRSLEACSRVLNQFENEPSFRDLGEPPIHAELVRFAAELHYLLIAISPFCGDRISLRNVVFELASAYGAQALPVQSVCLRMQARLWF
ncbi:MAG: condensation domain-containing protein [Methylocella sp.]